MALSYKSILILVDHTRACQARIDAAIGLALCYEAHLTALYVIVDPSSAIFVRGYLPPEIMAIANAQEEALANDTLAQFSAAAERNQVPFETRIDRGFDDTVADIVGMHARYADLIVGGQTDPNDPPTIPDLPGQLVLACGRPVLLIPYIGAKKTFGEHVVIAWNAGQEVTRAVSDAMPILERASSVSVVSLNPRPRDLGHGDIPGADIALYLARHGVNVEVQHIETDIDVGNTLLSHMANEGADLLIMGGYGHSRLRQVVFGGATRTMLGEMTVPVLMSH